MRIRPAESGDTAAVLGAYQWLFAAPGSVPPGWDPERAFDTLEELIRSGDAEVLVAEEGEVLVGICTVYRDIMSVRFGQRAWVEDLAVDPGRRSRGVGKSLLDGAKGWARERGAIHLELDSSTTRTDAHRFYERESPDWRSLCFAWRL